MLQQLKDLALASLCEEYYRNPPNQSSNDHGRLSIRLNKGQDISPYPFFLQKF